MPSLSCSPALTRAEHYFKFCFFKNGIAQYLENLYCIWNHLNKQLFILEVQIVNLIAGILKSTVTPIFCVQSSGQYAGLFLLKCNPVFLPLYLLVTGYVCQHDGCNNHKTSSSPVSVTSADLDRAKFVYARHVFYNKTKTAGGIEQIEPPASVLWRVGR